MGTKAVVYDDTTLKLRPIDPVNDTVVVGLDKKYKHTQTTPSSTWVIIHALGVMPVDVRVVDSAGVEVVGEIQRGSETINSVVVVFSFSLSGEAYVRPM
jgi:hypothetical protein